MMFNYKRVSTVIQNTERQLQDVPCDRLYEDKLSGKDTNRPEFQTMMNNLRFGDVINVHSLDRVGRNTKDILEIVQQVKDKGCVIHFHKENLKFDGTKTDMYSELLLTILAGFSAFERNIILERQREGIAIAKEKGVYKGRKSKLTKEQVNTMKIDFENGLAKTEIAKKYGVTRAYVYQLVNM
jgi:DNA invertase Pin-like site-specific DNA recombinase